MAQAALSVPERHKYFSKVNLFRVHCLILELYILLLNTLALKKKQGERDKCEIVFAWMQPGESCPPW